MTAHAPRFAERPAVPAPVLAMAIFLFTEVMLFAGLVSGYVILRQGVAMWPPPDQPRFPVAITTVNTAVLLASGVFVWYSVRALLLGSPERARNLLGLGWLAGLAFLAVQGVEWARLLEHGLATRASLYGGLFTLIVGVHALHVAAAVAVLGWARLRLARPRAGSIGLPALRAVRMYWIFVVAVWPGLFALVYLW